MHHRRNHRMHRAGTPGNPYRLCGFMDRASKRTSGLQLADSAHLGDRDGSGVTRWGVWGSTIGVFVGLFFGFVGVIVGPLVGAILGELLGGKQMSEALRAGWGSFVGLLFGTLLKLICCGLMAVTLIQAIW